LDSKQISQNFGNFITPIKKKINENPNFLSEESFLDNANDNNEEIFYSIISNSDEFFFYDKNLLENQRE